MIGTLLIILPLIGIFVFGYWRDRTYSPIPDMLWFGSCAIFCISVICAIGVYINTSTYQTERNAIQHTLDRAREAGNTYELATIQKDVVEFNRQLELGRKFWNEYFDLWINDDILEIEPVQ